MLTRSTLVSQALSIFHLRSQDMDIFVPSIFLLAIRIHIYRILLCRIQLQNELVHPTELLLFSHSHHTFTRVPSKQAAILFLRKSKQAAKLEQKYIYSNRSDLTRSDLRHRHFLFVFRPTVYPTETQIDERWLQQVRPSKLLVHILWRFRASLLFVFRSQ